MKPIHLYLSAALVAAAIFFKPNPPGVAVFTKPLHFNTTASNFSLSLPTMHLISVPYEMDPAIYIEDKP